MELSQEELEEIVAGDHICDNKTCGNYLAYNECFNHSHAVCPAYEDYWVEHHRPINYIKLREVK